MFWFYYLTSMLIRLLIITLIIFFLSTWFDFIYCRMKSYLSRAENCPGWISITGTIKTIFKYNPLSRPALYNFNLFKNTVIFLGSILFFVPVPFGQIIITISDLHPSLAGINLLHFADLPHGILLLLIPIYTVGLLGINFSPENNFARQLAKKRILELFFPASLCLTVSLLSIIQAAGTLSPAEIISFQAREGWMIFYQLPSFLIFISVVYFFYLRLFAGDDSRKLNVIPGEEDYAAASILLNGSKKIYIAGVNSLVVFLFFGGFLAPFHSEGLWNFLTSIPGVKYIWGPFWFLIKITILYFTFSLARSAIVRISHQQVKTLLWKGGVVLSLANYIFTVLITEYFGFDSFNMVLLSFTLFIATLLFINLKFSVPTGQSVKLKK
ncbi:MAG: NADH-quinone oxidoreductase subunit H [bacterium]